VAFLTLVLLLAGALVTSNEAGDSVPDWPLSFGRWLIDSDYFVANVRYEYSHRVIAGVVGFSTFILALWTWRTDKRRWMRRLALVAFVGVVAQGIIGGVRVLLAANMPVNEVKPLVAVPHALIAQSFFALLVSIIVFTSRSWFEPREVKTGGAGAQLRRLVTVTVAAVLIQLVLGAGFRHMAFGVIPHVAGAVAVTVLIAWTSITAIRNYGSDSYLRRPAGLALGLVVAQVTLGVLAYIFRVESAGGKIATVSDFFGSMTIASLGTFNEAQPREPAISLTAAHLVVGALTLATLIVLALRCYQVIAPHGARAAEVPKTLGSSTRRATV
jgi:heme a synthase